MARPPSWLFANTILGVLPPWVTSFLLHLYRKLKTHILETKMWFFPSPKWGQDQGVTISSAAPYRSEAAPARQWLTLRLRLDERFWNCKAKWASDRQSFFLSQRSLNHNITPLLIASGTSKAMSCGPSRCWMPSRGASSQKNFMTLSLIYNILEAKFLFLSSDGSNADM